ncbi:MAG: hypothetical protein QOD96_2460 [Pseudonocardiales bacterium]|nr:hypothetical protein [Pseudonocardiales bacterium]
MSDSVVAPPGPHLEPQPISCASEWARGSVLDSPGRCSRAMSSAEAMDTPPATTKVTG